MSECCRRKGNADQCFVSQPTNHPLKRKTVATVVNDFPSHFFVASIIFCFLSLSCLEKKKRVQKMKVKTDTFDSLELDEGTKKSNNTGKGLNLIRSEFI